MVTTYSISVWGDDKVLEVRGAYTTGLYTCKWLKMADFMLCIFYDHKRKTWLKWYIFILGILSHGFLFFFFFFLKGRYICTNVERFLRYMVKHKKEMIEPSLRVVQSR